MNKKEIDICHVYPITSGTAGTYIDKIYQALRGHFSQIVFVNYYFPFEYGEKIFYKYSDLGASFVFLKRHNKLRRFIRFIELLYGLYKVYIYVRLNKIKILNYSLNSDLIIEYLFLRGLKAFGVKIVITCHDVLPFGVNMTNIKKTRAFKRKKLFFELADSLIVHNTNSVEELANYYKIKGDKVVLSPFPVMDIAPFYKEGCLPKDIQQYTNKNSFKVVMVGHFRKEKGLNILLESWGLFFSKNKNACLIIAGNFPDRDGLNEINTNLNICVHDGFIDDNAYAELIKKADVVVMPYTRGTNSGIPSSIISMGTLVLTSDIKMFMNNPLIARKMMFKSESAQSLAEKLNWLYSMSKEEMNNLVIENFHKLETVETEFAINIIDSYCNIIELYKSGNIEKNIKRKL